MFIFSKLIELFFSKQFALAAIKLISKMKNYSFRFLFVSALGVLIVGLDMLSALVAGLLILAIQKVDNLELFGALDIANPLIGLPNQTASVVAVCIIVSLQVFREGALLANELVSRRLGILVGADLKKQVSKVALYTPFEHLSKLNKNDIIMYGNNFAAGAGTFAMEFSRLLSSLVVILLYSIFFLFFEPYAFFFIGTVVLTLIFITNKILLKLEDISSKFRNTELSFFGKLQDSMSGYKDIAIYEARIPFFTKIHSDISKQLKLQWNITIIQNLITPLQRSSALLILGASLIVLILFEVNGVSIMEPERVVFIIFILLRLYSPISQLNAIRSSLLARSAPVVSIIDFLEMEIGSKNNSNLSTSSYVGNYNKKLSGDIRLENLKYYYSMDQEAILNDVSLVLGKRKSDCSCRPYWCRQKHTCGFDYNVKKASRR